MAINTNYNEQNLGTLFITANEQLTQMVTMPTTITTTTTSTIATTHTVTTQIMPQKNEKSEKAQEQLSLTWKKYNQSHQEIGTLNSIITPGGSHKKTQSQANKNYRLFVSNGNPAMINRKIYRLFFDNQVQFSSSTQILIEGTPMKQVTAIQGDEKTQLKFFLHIALKNLKNDSNREKVHFTIVDGESSYESAEFRLFSKYKQALGRKKTKIHNYEFSENETNPLKRHKKESSSQQPLASQSSFPFILNPTAPTELPNSRTITSTTPSGIESAMPLSDKFQEIQDKYENDSEKAQFFQYLVNHLEDDSFVDDVYQILRMNR